MVFILPIRPKAPSEYERRKHKCLRSEIVKEGIIEANDGRQQPTQAVGFEDIS